MFYNSSYPEVYGNQEESTKERAPSHHITKAGLRWRWVVMALFVAAAIAIGTGVGIWRHREHSTTIRCGLCKGLLLSWLTFIVRQRRRILMLRILHNIFLMIHLWRRCLSLTAIGIYSSRTRLVLSDVQFVLLQTANGAQAHSSMPAQIPRIIHP